MDDFHCVRFETPAEFFEATKSYDDSFMNWGIGSLNDFLRKANGCVDHGTLLLGIFRAEALLLTLTKENPHAPWKLCVPCCAQDHLDAEIQVIVITLLCSSLLAQIGPSAIDQVSGPEGLVTAFLTAWIALLGSRGRRLHLVAPIFSWAVSYATRASLPPLCSGTSAGGFVTLAAEPDAVTIAPLHVNFVMTSPWPGTITRDEAVAFLARTISARLTWVYRKDDEVAGYAILGRVTPRTISLRNMYVAPQHRRQGIAEAMVRAITRYYLGVLPSGAEHVEGSPSVGIKEEVNLLVEDPGAERMYQRAGFLFPDRTGEVLSGGHDPTTGRKAWYHAVWRDIEPEPSH
ncbi:hypothetical protein L226DRAFT_479156 [Lentinus tigrinus ALCF2SS1-7]|uniref:N-acetyltransferase domain-containing protein n=1 Tax=Lentinus tigrinus ALCF2SS1-6 TaxID=1328759 RepID=A0A5C2T1Q4_9APHY|nr:hypothetical protein L227DRAFT_597638 [Lentinus tigrinus ALCF2SS1-6]RPD80399.1 hypothetical protein L226DRAFT_479156 [Lentinus tigrinus ALCF2SS1-7]